MVLIPNIEGRLINYAICGISALEMHLPALKVKVYLTLNPL